MMTAPLCSYAMDQGLTEAGGHTHWEQMILFTDRRDGTAKQTVTAYRDSHKSCVAGNKHRVDIGVSNSPGLRANIRVQAFAS